MRILIILIAIFILLIAGSGCGGDDNIETGPTPSPERPEKSDTPQPDVPQISDLTNKTWVLVEVQGNEDEWGLSEEIEINLQLSVKNNQHLVSGYSGCNTYRGTFGIDENAFFVDDLTYTERACPAEGIMSQENNYLSALRTAHSIDLNEDGDLLIIGYGVVDPAYLVFQFQPAASPTATPSTSPTPEAEPSPAETPVITQPPQLMPGSVMVSIYLDQQKSGTQAQKCQFPVNIGFYPPNSDPAILAEPASSLFYFSGTANCLMTESGTKIMVEVGPVNPGTYDITADTPTTLLNVKRNVHIE